MSGRKYKAKRPISPKNSFRQIVAAATYNPGSAKPVQPVLLLNTEGDRLGSPCLLRSDP